MPPESSLPERTPLTKVIGVGTALYFVQNILVQVLSVGSAFIVIGTLGVYEYGLLVLARSVFDTFNNFGNIGIASLVLTELNIARSEGRGGAVKAIFLDYAWLRGIIMSVSFAILFFGSFIAEQYSENAVIALVRLFSLVLVVYFLRTTFSTLFNVYLKYNYQVYAGLLDSVGYFLALLVFVYAWQMGVEGAIYAFIFSQVLTCIVFVPVYLNLYGELRLARREPTRHLWTMLKRHGKWSVFENYVTGVSKNLRPWIAAAFLSVEAVAIFSVAQSLLGHLTSLVPVDKVLTPLIPLERGDRQKVAEIFFRSFKYSLYVSLALALGAFLFMPLFLAVFFPKYLPSVPIFNIILPVFVFASFTGFLNIFYDTFRLQRDFFSLTIARLVALVVLAVPLIYFFGLIGLALEYLLSTLFFGMLRYFWLLRRVPELRVKFSKLFVFDEIDRIVAGRVYAYARRWI